MGATKTCPSCGAENDLIFTNCLFCKTSLPQVDLNSISNEDLILNAGEWIGKVGSAYDYITEHYNSWNDSGRIRMSANIVEGTAQKYLSLLQVRAINNQYLMTIYSDLKNEYDNKRKGLLYKIGGGDKKMGIVFVLFIAMFIFFIAMFYSH